MAIELIRGDTAYLYGEDAVDRDGKRLLLTGMDLWFTLKPTNSETAVVEMSLSGGGAFGSSTGRGAMELSPDGYSVEVILAAEDTDGLDPAQTYRCDLQLGDGSGAIVTLAIENSVRVSKDVTRRTTLVTG